MEIIKSPIRYPGAKGRAMPQIAPLIPNDFEEYREPFLGGGSVFLYTVQKYGCDKKYWINDLNYRLYNFWKQTQESSDSMIEQILEWKSQYQDGKILLQFLRTNLHKFDEIQSASAYFTNKTLSFSGFARGFSEENFRKSFTKEKIAQLMDISNLLRDTQVTNLDYQKLVDTPGDNVFIFLDPPYYSVKWDELYGTIDTNLHANFDHARFAKVMKVCKHRWLITYDDSQMVRQLFSFANIIPWELTYTSRKVKTGKELFISNYLKDMPREKQVDNIESAWLS